MRQHLSVSEDTAVKLKKYTLEKYGKLHGCLIEEVEAALKYHLEAST